MPLEKRDDDKNNDSDSDEELEEVCPSPMCGHPKSAHYSRSCPETVNGQPCTGVIVSCSECNCDDCYYCGFCGDHDDSDEEE